MREIFSLATTEGAPDRALPAESGGLTLEELKHIGQEAGIDPARIAQAAASLGARGNAAPTRRSLGMPVGVSRVVDLPRAPTDREWEQLITHFRTTFETQGRATSSGNLREWSQGNLHISVEPTQRGHRLRLSTLKGDAVPVNAVGFVMTGMSALMGAAVAAAGQPDKALIVAGVFGGFALVAFGINVIRLPRWARERERQMEAIAERAVTLLCDSQ